MLYIFAGFPRSGLNAGGIQHLIERVEEMGVLEHNPTVQTTKEHTDTCRISDACLALIERGARPEPRDAYEDKHFSEIRRWDGKRSQVLAGV